MKHDTHEMAFGLRVVELVWFALVGCALFMGMLNPWLLSTGDTLWAWLSRALLLGFSTLVAGQSVWLGAEYLRYHGRHERAWPDGPRDGEDMHDAAA